jgi:LAO/AO transport system kinase
MTLAERIRSGDVRALARAISKVENRSPDIEELLRELRSRAGRAHVVGLTGPPGGGKSSLTDGLIERWRAAGQTVGVIAVDPSSPFTGGALLGDRVRMQRHATDRGVFIRSMAARGHLGGLAAATREAIRLIDASGRDRCLLETVGVGQSELEVMQTADTTVVITTPAGGDGIQVIKAGILEIADIFVINKADMTGADKVAKELRRLVHETKTGTGWEPPVVLTVATSGEGVDELVAAIDRHRARIEESGELQRRREERFRAEVESIVADRAVSAARQALRGSSLRIQPDGDLSRLDPYDVADRILGEGLTRDNGHPVEE